MGLLSAKRSRRTQQKPKCQVQRILRVPDRFEKFCGTKSEDSGSFEERVRSPGRSSLVLASFWWNGFFFFSGPGKSLSQGRQQRGDVRQRFIRIRERD